MVSGPAGDKYDLGAVSREISTHIFSDIRRQTLWLAGYRSSIRIQRQTPDVDILDQACEGHSHRSFVSTSAAGAHHLNGRLNFESRTGH
jgi:hypothetical protein